MGNTVSSLLGYNEDIDQELTLEKACNLLKSNETEKIVEVDQDSYNPRQSVLTKNGVITEILGDKLIIDGCYVFTDTGTNFNVGSKVSYNLFCSGDTFKVSNVELVNSEWDLVEDSNSIWTNRVYICQVAKRIERKLYLTVTDIVLNLDEIPLEFLPIVGDWLELDVKCMIDENALDLSGKIIEINKISPVRLHIETGKITYWKNNEKTGSVNNKIFFNEAALSMGYIPVLGDKIIAEVIESDQNRCSWRAIKIIPESTSVKYCEISKRVLNTKKYQDTYPGLNINDITLTFDKLGETKLFSINISNNSTNENFILQNAEFMQTSQCKLVDDNNFNTEILPGSSYKIICECTAKNIGQSNDLIMLTFNNVTIGKWINISVTVTEENRPIIHFEFKKNLGPHEESNNELIRGNRGATVRFLAVKIPNYSVPQRLIDVISNSSRKNREEIIEQVSMIKPSLVCNLTRLNYEDKYHTLLHLDEIANLISIRTYDQDRVCFIKDVDYLMLEIDNLSERRPSLIIGDRIVATDPLNQKGVDYEGFIHKVGAKHVYLKFNQVFHDNYNGEDYSIKVIPGRASYKRLHHAVHLAIGNLGQDILFPTKITEKDPQINFLYDEDTPVSSPNLSKAKVKNILRKIQESNNRKLDPNLPTNDDPKGEQVKLEWYNKELNPNQKSAVRHILWGKARPLPYIIFGPPGTGKTVTIIETILQIVRLIPFSRLLVTAPSNSAADLIAIRLIDSGVLKPGDLVRVVSYNYAMGDMIPAKLVPYCATASPAKEDTYSSEMSEGGIQFDCSQSTLGRHRITVATCSATGQFYSMGFARGHFTHIIVDEAAQAGEPDVMIPMSFMDKNNGQVILAGDPMQLGPVVICKIAAECGLMESYLERLINRFPYVKDPEGFADTSGFDPRLVTKLLYNYRALPDILHLYNTLFYNSELIPTIDEESSKEAKLLVSLQEMLPRKIGGSVAQIVFHGVDGENYQTPDSPSWFNPHEAAQVFYYINELYRLGLDASRIGIITPYIKQVKEIRSLLVEAEFDVPRVGTIEEFQGQEFDVILLSTVRSCEEYIVSDITHSLGFVASPKRLNVAISRAKSLLVIIGNPKLLCHDTYWRSVVKYCVEKGCYVGCDF